jgi:uncharacterized membrane protein
MDNEREPTARAAYALYTHLRRLAQTLPGGHPVRPALAEAAEAAYRHWRDLAAAAEDRVLAVSPARERPAGR